MSSCSFHVTQGIFEGMGEEPSSPTGPAKQGKRRKRRGRPKSEGSGVSHQKRGPVVERHPWFVTVKLAEGLPSLRGQKEFDVVLGALRDSCTRAGRLVHGRFHMVHFSVQDDHAHLIVEAKDRLSLSRAMTGFCTRMAKRLNALWGRKGKVYADRYHSRELKTPTEVRNALRYLFRNGEKHGRVPAGSLDWCSSAWWFRQWEDVPIFTTDPSPVAQAQSWLLREGWKRAGPLRLREPLPLRETSRAQERKGAYSGARS